MRCNFFKLNAFISIFVVLFLLCSCNTTGNYDGEESARFEYVTCDFNGGITTHTILDLSSGQLLKKTVFPPSEAEDVEYTILNTLDEIDCSRVVNIIHHCGLLSLEESYTTEDEIIDGGSWTFTVSYKNGSKRVSNGVNAGPSHLFAEADQAIFSNTGVSLFGRVATN